MFSHELVAEAVVSLSFREASASEALVLLAIVLITTLIFRGGRCVARGGGAPSTWSWWSSSWSSWSQGKGSTVFSYELVAPGTFDPMSFRDASASTPLAIELLTALTFPCDCCAACGCRCLTRRLSKDNIAFVAEPVSSTEARTEVRTVGVMSPVHYRWYHDHPRFVAENQGFGRTGEVSWHEH